jgi:molecular chaperone Hsp33
VSDALLKSLFSRAPVRCEAVRLVDAWQGMTAHHDYPPPVLRLLGEMTAAAALLASNIKFNGTLILQIHGDGPVQLLVVECQPDLRMRATAKLRDGATIGDEDGLRTLVNAHGHGRCALTLDPRDRLPGVQPYQGVVSLEGDSMAEVLEVYMRQSEQLESRFWLAADDKAAAGVLLQKIPQEGGRQHAIDADAWERGVTLAKTLTPGELLAHAPVDILRRLFWQEQLEPATSLAPRFECSCSRERIGRMLLSLGREEVDSILAERRTVEVTCDFCNRSYEFDAIDVQQLFATGSTAEADTARPH